MNSAITFPSPAPTLKLARPSAEKWAATVAEERRRLQEDHDILREREANLRDYEARLRAWQAELDAGRAVASVAPAATVPLARASSRTPFTDDAALQAAWEKLHRARELLEAEQAHLRDDRISLKEQQDQLKQHQQELDERETRLAEREALILAATPEPVAAPVASEHTMSAVTRLTKAPFDIARSMFGGKK